MKYIKYFGLGLLFIFVLALISLKFLSYSALGVSVGPNMSNESYGWKVQSQDPTPIGQIILFQGGLVDAKAYLPLADQLSKVGYEVYLLDAFLDVPFFARDAAQNLINAEGLSEPILLGHSLGGVVASQVAAAYPEQSDLVLLASYPSDQTDLSNFSGQVLSITASLDGVLNLENWQAAKDRLPSQTVYYSIQGGNHAQFASYGPQKGDQAAKISGEDQQAQVAKQIKQTLSQE
ncbi:TPA: alpha/beta fold hydrolase [Streptococcus suis]